MDRSPPPSPPTACALSALDMPRALAAATAAAVTASIGGGVVGACHALSSACLRARSVPRAHRPEGCLHTAACRVGAQARERPGRCSGPPEKGSRLRDDQQRSKHRCHCVKVCECAHRSSRTALHKCRSALLHIRMSKPPAARAAERRACVMRQEWNYDHTSITNSGRQKQGGTPAANLHVQRVDSFTVRGAQKSLSWKPFKKLAQLITSLPSLPPPVP